MVCLTQMSHLPVENTRPEMSSEEQHIKDKRTGRGHTNLYNILNLCGDTAYHSHNKINLDL